MVAVVPLVLAASASPFGPASTATRGRFTTEIMPFR